MAEKTEKADKTGKGDAQLTGKQFKELSKQLETLFKRNSNDMHDLRKEVRKQISNISELVQAGLEKQSLETLSAFKSADDFARRSDGSTADLLSQVSSLRDYLSRQQNLVRKLQDGYDWTILRSFCLRIIRCIDDVEKRLKSTDDISDAHRQDLEMIHDELVFALDGSGVEQFQPEIDTPYSGQERFAEVTGKSSAGEGGKPGHISEIKCPGYYYYISEEQRKLIRPAKVKLYEKEPEGSDEVE